MKSPTKVDEPLVPDELQNRGGIALTPLAAQGDGIESISEAGDTAGAVPLRQQPGIPEDQIKAIDRLCANPPGFNATAGLKADEVLAIMARTYEGMPEMGPTGDLDPKVIIWLYENHPHEARVRYALRLMPTVGRWIARWHPSFRYEDRKVIEHTFAPPAIATTSTTSSTYSTVKVVTNTNASPTIESLRRELQELKQMVHYKQQKQEEDFEAKKLMAEIAELKSVLLGDKTSDVPPQPEKIPTRRPRKSNPAS